MKLSICAWGPYPGKVEVDFTKFEAGSVFLVTGPTGAGKTTIFDAICYALYGNVSGENRDKATVRSDFAAPEVDTYVDFTFLHKGEQYQIRRTPKRERPKKRGEGFTTSPETAILTLPEGEPVATVNDVNLKVQEIMGIDFNQFKQIAMIAQGEFLNLLFANSEQKVKIFRNLFQTQLYDRIKMNLSIKERALYGKIREHTNKIEEAIASIQCGDNNLLNLAVTAQNKNYDTILSLLKESNQEESARVKALKKEAERLDEIYTKQINEINFATELNKNIDLLKEVKATLIQLGEVREEMNAKREQIGKARKAQQVAAQEKLYLDSIKRKDQWEEKITEAQHSLELIGIEQVELEEKLKHSKEMEDAVETLNQKIQRLELLLPQFAQLEDAEKKGIDAKRQLDQMVMKRQELQQILEQLKKEKLELTNHLKQYEGLEKELSEIKVLLVEAKQQYQSMRSAKILYKNVLQESVELEKVQKQYLAQEQIMLQAKELFEGKERLYRSAAIGLAAKYLKDNQPCPVCGSLEHPKKAEISHEVPDEQEVEQEKKKFEKEQALYHEIYNRAAAMQGALESKKKEFETTLEQLNLKDQQELEQSYELITEKSKVLLAKEKQLNEMQQKKAECNEKLALYDSRIEKSTKDFDDKTNQLQEIKSIHDELKGTIANIKLQLPKDFQRIEVVEAALQQERTKRSRLQFEMQQIQKQKEALIARKESTQALLVSYQNQKKSSEDEVRENLNKFMLAKGQAGFVTDEDYEAAKMTQDAIQYLEAEIVTYDKKLMSYQEQERMLAERIDGKSYVDLTKMKEDLTMIQQKRKELQLTNETIVASLHGNERAYHSIQEKYEKISEVSKEYGYVSDLEKAAKGQNMKRTVFEHYVLAAYFEDILEAANLRLSVMSNSRYELLKVEKVGDSRTTNSLDIEVFDQYTGKRRPVKTLSGGESFKAALSLALGLSDIIQQNAGGIEVDTLFIDEGFGSLDSESLDTALKTLMNLTGKNRLIGIISHVGELKERVENQIIVEKDKTGSKLKVVY